MSSASHASADSQLTARTDRHSGSRYGVFVRRVDYVIHYVESLKRSVTFYRDVIGLQVRIEGDGAWFKNYLELPEGVNVVDEFPEPTAA